MEFKLYIRALQRNWWIIVFTMLLAMNLSLLVSYLTTPIYQVTSRFVVSPNAGIYNDSWDIVSSLDTLDRRSIINTYKELMASRSIVEKNPQIQSLGIEDINADYTVSVAVVPDTNILQLVVEGPDPDIALQVSNAISDKALAKINELYPVYNFSVLDEPEKPLKPIRPQPIQNAALALLFGVIIGTGLAFSREQLQNSLEQLRARSIVDSATSAYKRDFFERRLREEIANNSDASLSLGLIRLRGLDDFIGVIPQSITDRALNKITQTLKNELRGRDIVGRWDKTVLSVLLPSTPVNAVETTFKRLQSYLAEPIFMDDAGDLVIHPEPCIGVASRGQLDSSDEIVALAENAVEQASSLSKASVVVLSRPFLFDPEAEIS